MAVISLRAKFLAVYNQDRANNGLPPIAEADFDFGDPSAYSGPRSPASRRVILTSKPGSPNIGRIAVYYDAIALSTITTLQVEKGAAVNVVDLIPQLNEELGLILVAADIVNGVLPATTGFTLTASDTNLLFTGAVQVAYI